LFSYVSGRSDTPLLGETIGQCLNRIVSAFERHEALVSCHQGLGYTWGQLSTIVDLAARGLLSLGVNRGDRVGIFSPNCAEWAITQYAAAKAGAILVNINPAYRLRELGYALGQSGVSVLVAARGFRSADYVAMLQALRPELPALEHIVYLGAGEPGHLSWRDLLERGEVISESSLRARESSLQFDDPVNIQYTSGTTGSPKGATLSHHNLLNNGFFIGEALAYTERDRICVPVPFYHCFGCVLGNLAALTHASAVVLPGESFEPEAALGAIETERCTSLYGVPSMFIAQLDSPGFARYRLDSLRTGIMAGSPCPTEVMRPVIGRMHMPDVTIAYGMTETSPVSFQSAMDDPVERRVSTVGSIHPHLECKIVDPQTGDVVPRGGAGELCTRGYAVMLGYWNDQAATDAAIDRPLDAHGRSRRHARRWCGQYRRAAEGHDHPRRRERLSALRDGQSATADDIRGFCRGQIAGYKIPRYVRFTTEFPMTVTGKIQKFRMREISIVELGLEHAAEMRTA
jgi:fatty-acyl-CoA synthase